MQLVGAEKLSDPSSPHAQAAEWLIHEDALALGPDAENLEQRYLLALFYIDTTQARKWLSCNRPADGDGDDCLFMELVRAFPEFVYQQVSWFRWLSGRHECLWAGVSCDEFNLVRQMNLGKCTPVKNTTR